MTDPNSGPTVSDNYFTERDGVLAVEHIVNRIRCVWRETPHADVGIDGQIEHVNSHCKVTGRIVAVQVKAGKSYINIQGHNIVFRPSEKHVRYWENFPLPVLLVIYDPDADKAYWTDARQALRSPSRKEGDPILVPLDHVLDTSSREQLFETCGTPETPLRAVDDLITFMLEAHTANAGFDLSFFDLFVCGLMDISRKLFFHMSLAQEIAEYRLEEAESEFGVGIGYDEYEFIDAYVRFLVSQNIIVYDFADYLIDYYERAMTPVFVAPLTSRGRALRDRIRTIEDVLMNGDANAYPITAEMLIRLVDGDPMGNRKPLQLREFMRRLNASGGIASLTMAEAHNAGGDTPLNASTDSAVTEPNQNGVDDAEGVG